MSRVSRKLVLWCQHIPPQDTDLDSPCHQAGKSVSANQSSDLKFQPSGQLRCASTSFSRPRRYAAQPHDPDNNPSQIVYGDYLYTLYDQGFMTCHEASQKCIARLKGRSWTPQSQQECSRDGMQHPQRISGRRFAKGNGMTSPDFRNKEFP